MAAKQPLAQPTASAARISSKTHAHAKLVKTALLAILEHRPFATDSHSEKLAAWDRVLAEVWDGTKPKFDVQSVFNMLMTLRDQRDFEGWDAETYQLRTRLVQEVTSHSTTVSGDETGDRGGDDSDDDAAALSSRGTREPHPKRRLVTLSDEYDDEEDALGEEEDQEEDNAVGEDENSETEWMGEANGTSETKATGGTVDDWTLVRAIVANAPHSADDVHAAWGDVAVWVRNKGYSRKLSVPALKLQFGRVVNMLGLPVHSEDPNAELRAMLLAYCKSAVRTTIAMKRFLRFSAATSSETMPSGTRRRSTRARNQAQDQEHEPEPELPQAAPADSPRERQYRRLARSTTAKTTYKAGKEAAPQAREETAQETQKSAIEEVSERSSGLTDAQLDRMLESFDAIERHRDEATKQLLSIIGDYRKVPDGTRA